MMMVEINMAWICIGGGIANGSDADPFLSFNCDSLELALTENSQVVEFGFL
ncbi:hypothetical protein ACF3DV_21230 [Chlorogloeopsis fritschii PCC 9212]|uniref:Uncharacterized protein n=1 Tax=Chlorogloeopsis fritschii PCC 6912 TaxID=211165 RepID=A0A3S0ZLW4_CHLFR|nr:hypothetical protein [Chlorogloeopsis fritschii]RUR75494.1 hypothetical protein PCC6912_47250 [Chlorogloeopsis fritschii PCC 6912]